MSLTALEWSLVLREPVSSIALFSISEQHLSTNTDTKSSSSPVVRRSLSSSWGGGGGQGVRG